MSFVSSRIAVSLLAALGMAGCDVTVEDDGSTLDEGELPTEVTELEEATARGLTWAHLRADRQARLDRYLTENNAELQAFLYRPLGTAGVPTAMLRAFPVAFPEIWGTPDQFFAKQGLFKDPFNASNPFPAGLGTVNVNGVDFTTLSCAGCHLGRVQKPDGTIVPLIGAPNTTFNQFRTSVEATVANETKYFAVFGRSVGTETFRRKVLGRLDMIEKSLAHVSYNRTEQGYQPPVADGFDRQYSNAPDLNAVNKPGYLDAIGVAAAALVGQEYLAALMTGLPVQDDPTFQAAIQAVMPLKPAQVDIVSIWRQSARPMAQWDGSIANPIYRNLGASVGVIGDPAAVDYDNAAITADFSQDLPSPPYPFDVNLASAVKGGLIYADACLSCHRDGNRTIYPVSAIGTDPNRTVTVTPAQRQRFIFALRSACKDAVKCNVDDSQIIRDMGEVTDTSKRGYVAGPLDGIWARAPYLHNGSVPTLEHLLLPLSRPPTFKRGSIRYDQARVGFAWEEGITDANTHVFDTKEAGASNAGHAGPYRGLSGTVWDFAKSPRDRAYLLEFLKTL
jgi:hypothetical protein